MQSPAPTPRSPSKPKHKLISLQQLDFALSRLGVDTHVTSDDIFKVLDEEETKQRTSPPEASGKRGGSNPGEERPPQYPGFHMNDTRTPRRSQSTPTPGTPTATATTNYRGTTFTELRSPPADADREDMRRELVLNNAEEAIPEGADGTVDPYITTATPL